jgi:hypothetical protein
MKKFTRIKEEECNEILVFLSGRKHISIDIQRSTGFSRIFDRYSKYGRGHYKWRGF